LGKGSGKEIIKDWLEQGWERDTGEREREKDRREWAGDSPIIRGRNESRIGPPK